MPKRKDHLVNLWKKFAFTLNSLHERIRLQKTIYILSQLKYPSLSSYSDFGMYLHGPYSPTLASEAYQISDQVLNESANYAADFSQSEKEKIDLFEEILTTVRKSGKSIPDYMNCELIADIIYFKKNNEFKTNAELATYLKSRKPYFDDLEKFGSALKLLNEKSII